MTSSIVVEASRRGKSGEWMGGKSTSPEIDPVCSTFGIRIDVLYHISMSHPVQFDRCQLKESMIHCGKVYVGVGLVKVRSQRDQM